jgi:tRNA threonylcarbamoyl adenosine modification protein YeaZ
MKHVLFIDTSDSQKIRVGLDVKGKRVEKIAEREQKAQMVLPMIEDLLKTQKLKLSDITEIKVNPGPGSFTGLRVGIAVAQMLGKLLNIPVNGKPAGELHVRYRESRWE